jgi:glyoxylase-like metal-dependent hydrolase (beta-lactamase superfamily II)
MLIEQPCKLAEGIYLLGEKQSLVYLVRGEDAMIIGGGMNWIAPKLEEQLVRFEINASEIKYLVIQHSHFDHCGAAPYLKRRFPNLKILATESARQILSKSKVINYIEMVNKFIIDAYGLQEQYEKMGLKIDAIEVDETVGDTSIIDLGGGLEVQFIETPGHSRCAVAVYLPGSKAIFPTDAAPCPIGSIEKLARPSPQYDFTLYKQSLMKMLNYDIDICGFDHFAAVTGSDAGKVLQNGLDQSIEYGKRIVGLYQQGGDLESIARQVAHESMEADSFDFMNEDMMMPISRAEVRNILKSSGVTDA